MTSPLVSVVIPTYNRARDLSMALASVVQQTYPHWEALAVDNHSTDETEAMVRGLNDPRIRFLQIRNGGVIAASRNLGIREAAGEFVAFLDSDDFWTADKLERCVACLAGGADVVYHDMDYVFRRRAYLARRRFDTRPLTPPILNDLLVNANTLPTSSVVVRTALLRKAGGFSEDAGIVAGEDYDLWLRLAGLTDRFTRVDGTLGSLARGHDNESSASRMIALIEAIQRVYMPALSEEERGRARVNWIDYEIARARYRLGEFAAARPSLFTLLRTSHVPMFRLKSLYMLLAMTVRRSGAHS